MDQTGYSFYISNTIILTLIIFRIQRRKLYYINKISLQNPKSKSLDDGTDKESDVSEKSSKETPKRSQSVTESLLKGLDSSSESSPNKKKVNIYHDIIRSAF